MDSDGVVDYTDPSSDDSVLYVGMDIANGDPRMVGGHLIDIQDLTGPGLCDDGTPDLNNDGQANVFMIPFDADGDGDASTVTRFNEEGDPNCQIEISPVTGDLTSETYELEVFACGGDRGLKLSGDRLFLFRLTMEEGVGQDVVELKVFKDVDHMCTDFNVAEVTGSHEGLTAAQLTALGQNPDFGRDIEFVIKRIDSLVVTAHGTYPGCTEFPDYREVRFALGEGGVSTLSGAIGDLSEEDVIEAPFTIVAPEIEVTKGVRCAGDTGRLVVAQALPESTVEFVIDVENTGNVDLAVTLDDVLQEFGLATATVDETYLGATLYRPADGSGIVETIAFDNAGDYGLNPTFFVPGGSGSPGFLGGVIDGAARYMGVLQGVSACPTYVPGDKMELVFRVRVDAPEECDGQIDPDIRNKITAVGDPDIPPVADGDEVTDAPGNVPLDELVGVDTYREMHVNSPASDDNVADVQILCRKLTFEKEARYVADCENPPACDDDTDFSDTAVIPQEATLPICIQYRYTITNDGEVDELIDLSEEFLAGDIGPGVEFDCTLPLVLNDVILSAGGGHVQVCCVLKFTTEEALDDFLTFDDARECNAIQPPGYNDPGCYSNCAKVTADVTNLEGICNGVPPLELYDYATFCDGRCTGRIGDFVWYDGSEADCNGCQEDGEQGIPNVTVVLKDAGGAVIATDVTDANGYYLFTGLCAGDYTVEVDESTLPDGYYPSPSQQDCADPSTANDSNGSPADVTLTTDHSEDLTIDFGYCTPCDGRIGDFVWYDGNSEECNGCQEPGEQGIPNVTVVLKDAGGAVIATDVTDANGYYLFTGLCAGDYTVEVDESTLPDGYYPSPSQQDCADPSTANDSNGSPADVTLTTDHSEDLTIDFGYCTPCDGRIGDFVWYDGNSEECNGCQEPGEQGIPNVTVVLKDAGGAVIATDVTDADGYYLFTGLCAGDYTVEVDESTLPDGYYASPSQQDCADPSTANDSNGSPADVTLTTDHSEDLTIDFGYCTPCSGRIGDFVWLDGGGADCNGCQEDGEQGIPNVTVILKDASGAVIATTVTDADGYYLFTDLCAGDYTVEIDAGTLPPDVVPAPCTNPECADPAQANDNNCSPADVTLTEDDSEDLTIDFGYCSEGQCDLVLEKRGCVIVPGTCVPTVWISATPAEGGEGCSHGYWKNHTGNWPDPYSPWSDFDATFGVNVFNPNKSLYRALGLTGGGVNALAREATAALLNAASAGVDYSLSVSEVIAMVQGAVAPGGDVEGTKDTLEFFNTQNCPFDRCEEPCLLQVTFGASDNCGEPTVTGVIDIGCQEIPVTSGQIVQVQCDTSGCEYQWMGNILVIESPQAVLNVTAGGADCGTPQTCSLDLCDVNCDVGGSQECVGSGSCDGCEPSISISATPTGRDGGNDGGRCWCRLRVDYSATDNCGDATTSAYIDIGCDQIPVSDGQIVEYVCDTGKCDCWYYWDHGVLRIVSYQIVVHVTAEGECGTPKTCTLDLCALNCSQGGSTECPGGGDCNGGGGSGDCITEVPCEMSAGADVEYTYAVTNNSAGPVTDVEVVDDVLGEIPGSPIASIAAGETVTLTAIGFVTEETTNTATATGWLGDIQCEASDSATITFEDCDECDLVVDKQACVVMPDECEPTVWISATPSRDDGGRCGCRLRVNYGASDNCGDATLSAYIDIGCHLIPISDGQVVDFVCDTGKCDCWYYWDAGVLHIYSYQIVVYVTAEGECGTPKTCSLNLCALDCSQGGGTECTGGGDCGNGGECITEVPCEMSAGADVEYTYAITNNGDQAVTDVAVIDDVLGEIPGSPIPSIGPGETVTLSAIDFVTEETTNTVTVAGYVGQILCRASDTATITFEECEPCDLVVDKQGCVVIPDQCEPSISISATPTGRDGGTDGGRCWCRLRVNYSVTENCGDATTSAYIDIGCDQIPVSDGQIVEFVCDTGKCDCWYYWDAGVLHIYSYQIVVYVTAEGECGTPTTCSLNLCALNCSQGGSTECVGGGDCSGGDGECVTEVPCELSDGADVEYTFTITNNGYQAITDVAVIDDVLGEIPGSPIASIGVGETVTLSAVGFVTEETTNTVTVTGYVGQVECEATDSETITFEPCPGGQGCTPGYWKNHLWAWPNAYQPCDDFDATFGVDAFDPDITLNQAVWLGGGGVDALGRHAVAALLNAASAGVDYGMTVEQVIAAVQQALAPGGDVEGTKDLLESFNEQGCPLSGSIPTGVLGDVNCDGVINMFDVDLFAVALATATDDPPFGEYFSRNSACNPMRADMDQNGVVDLFDVEPFVDLLTAD